MNLPDEVGAAVHTVARRLKHDLGKYVSLQARWLPPDADANARREALVADVLHTRRGPGGSEGATDVWLPYEAMLTGRTPLDGGLCVDLSADEDVEGIRRHMDELGQIAVLLVADTVTDAQVERGLALARMIAHHATSLVLRTRQEP